MKRISSLLAGNELFQRTYFKKNERMFLDLARDGQQPRTLFLCCADSRVLPSLITSTAPGELFVLRNVGNFVAPYQPDQDYHATAAGIEYAVNLLEVKEIVVCGHSHCGAISALLKPDFRSSEGYPHIRKWLSLGESAREMAGLVLGDEADPQELQELTGRISVVAQLGNLLTYPYVKTRVDEGSLHLHGWMYDLESGEIEYFDPDEQRYMSLREARASQEAAVEAATGAVSGTAAKPTEDFAKEQGGESVWSSAPPASTLPD